MSQSPNPQPPKIPLESSLRQRTRAQLITLWEPLDEIGRAIMGDLWRTTYLTIQDALAATVVSIALHFIGLALQGTTGQTFSDLKACVTSYPITSVSRYQCLVIGAASFPVWFVFAGRFILHLWEDWIDFRIDWMRRRKDKLRQLQAERGRQEDGED